MFTAAKRIPVEQQAVSLQTGQNVTTDESSNYGD